MDNYTERMELPDGQWVVLLTRLPYDRAQPIRVQTAHDPTLPQFTDAVLRAFIWEASLKDALTGETIEAEDFGRAADEILSRIAIRAMELHHEWRKVAYPKGKTSTGARSTSTRRGARSTPPETDATS